MTYDSSGISTDFVAAIDWVISNGARPAVINMSWVTTSTFVRDALAQAIDAGIAVVKAAGNQDVDACNEPDNTGQWTIVVGGTNMSDTRVFSAYGSCVRLFAPAYSVISLGLGGSENTYAGT
jgi:serine protease